MSVRNFNEEELEDRRLLSSAAAEIFRMRRARDQELPRDLLGEPAWDILLALYIEQPGGVPLSSICYASGSPSSTAVRWITALERRGFAHREALDRDDKVVLVRLSTAGCTAVERSLKAMLRAATS